MRYFLHIALFFFLYGSMTPLALAQKSKDKGFKTDEDEYWKSIARIPYPKLNKKDLHSLSKIYIVDPINKWKEGDAFIDFKYKYHNLTRRRSTTLKSTNNSIEGTIEMTKENGETLAFDFQLLMSVFLVYSDHYEWRVYAINSKKNKDDQWGRLYDFAKQLK